MTDFTFPYQIALIIAGFLYIVTPGPVFLSIVSLVSERGRMEGYKFISGAIMGCMVWLTFTCASLIEADRLPHYIFVILAVVCASYLFFLGVKMFLHSIRKKDTVFTAPMRDGFLLALFNPKSYPVMTAVFSGVAIHYKDLMQWSHFVPIFFFAVFGFALGYVFMVFMSGFGPINRFYIRHIKYVSMAFGVIFILFGLNLLLGLMRQ